MSLGKQIVEDWKCNAHIKSKVILLLFRLAHASGCTESKIIKYLTMPYRLFYRLLVDWIFGVDIPWKTQLGRRVVLYHSFGLVINEGAIIGNDCILRHGVTIGNKITQSGESKAPRISDGVEFGAGAIVIGDIDIGSNVVIGAASVVTKSIESFSVVVGNPSRILRHK